MKIIFHIDIDAFFTSCEENRNSDLTDKKIVITSNMKNGIISACNYNARKLGIHSGMPSFKLKSYNDLVIINPDIKYYRSESNRFFDFIKQEISNNIEIYSIDEFYIDVTEKIKNYKTVKEYAIFIKNIIKEEFNFNVTIGISFNKFLAKMATNMHKPSGIGILNKENFKEKIYDLNIIKIHGLGRKQEIKYNNINIYKINQLVSHLERLKGDKGHIITNKTENKLYSNLIGLGSDFIEVNKKRKSLGHEKTFHNEIINIEQLENILTSIVSELASDLLNKSLYGDLLKLKIKYNKKIITKQIKMDKNIFIFKDIYRVSLSLLNTMIDEGLMIDKITLLGVSLGNVKNFFNNHDQLDIFTYKNSNKLETALENINKKYKKNIIYYSSNFNKH